VPPVASLTAEDAPWDTTVQIAPGPGGEAAPLFMVGGVGGNVNNLADLARALGRHVPIVGLQTRGILGHRMHDTIEATAADHVTYIRARQPDGPYRLAGYSGGAFIAFEIARQLQAAGLAVTYLGVLDMYAPGLMQPEKPGLVQRIAARLRGGDDAPSAEALKAFRSKLKRRLVRGRMLDLAYRIWPDSYRFLVFERQFEAQAAAYRPGALTGDLWLYETRGNGLQEARMRAMHPNFGWSERVTGRIHVREVPGDHLDMLFGTSGEVLAEKWRPIWPGAVRNERAGRAPLEIGRAHV
jgi:thioesterase domain-containing protein